MPGSIVFIKIIKQQNYDLQQKYVGPNWWTTVTTETKQACLQGYRGE